MKKIITLIILLIVCVTTVFANEASSSSMVYFKGGASLPPCQVSKRHVPVPSVGLGYRWQKGRTGFDLSLNAGSLFVVNYASVKGLFLFYPNPQESRFYFGVGPGYVHNVSIDNSNRCLSLEGVIGYEFASSCRCKPFIQLEITQPVVTFKSRFSSKKTPGVALMFGIGF